MYVNQCKYIMVCAFPMFNVVLYSFILFSWLTVNFFIVRRLILLFSDFWDVIKKGEMSHFAIWNLPSNFNMKYSQTCIINDHCCDNKRKKENDKIRKETNYSRSANVLCQFLLIMICIRRHLFWKNGGQFIMLQS